MSTTNGINTIQSYYRKSYKSGFVGESPEMYAEWVEINAGR